MLVVRLEDELLRIEECFSHKKVLKYAFSECGIRNAEYYSDGSVEIKSTLGLAPKSVFECDETSFLKLDSKLSVAARMKQLDSAEYISSSKLV